MDVSTDAWIGSRLWYKVRTVLETERCEDTANQISASEKKNSAWNEAGVTESNLASTEHQICKTLGWVSCEALNKEECAWLTQMATHLFGKIKSKF